MPHIHLLLLVDKDEGINTSEKVDQFICARIPPLPPTQDQGPAANQQRRLWHYVTTMMLHDCNAACLELDDQGKRRCRKHFPKPYSEQTELSEVRYTNYVRIQPEYAEDVFRAGAPDQQQNLLEDHLLPENDPERDWNEIRYQRIPGANTAKQGRAHLTRTYEKCGLTHLKAAKKGKGTLLLDDSRVIPYNSFLLLKYGCHVNVEYVFGQKACKYIFKYLLKGFTKAYVRVLQPRRGADSGQQPVYDYDEVAATFKVRYMTSMEAYLRLHSYKIVRLSHQIYTLSLHDESGQTIVIEEGQEERGRLKVAAHTRLTAFFDLCSREPQAEGLSYDRVPYFYKWNLKERCWDRRKNVKAEGRGAKMFVRVYSVSPKRRELFAIRALLLHRPGPTSFKDLRTVDGQVYGTFTEAAMHLGLMECDDIFVAAMRDACVDNMNLNRLQHYFAMLLVNGLPSDSQKLFDMFLDEMRPHKAGIDPDDKRESLELRSGEVMRNLEYYLNCMDTSSSVLGLCGLPADYRFSRQEALIGEGNLLDDFFGGADRHRTPQAIVEEHVKKLNGDQKRAFDRITEAINGRGECALFFVEGSGGCGKTFLYNTLIRWCLSGKSRKCVEAQEGQLARGSVISAASTGIAALLLIGGGTVHRQFSIPNDVSDDSTSRVSFESARARQLRAADIIIIDEISMLSIKALRYIDRQLRDVCANDKPFGGKCVVIGGDWKQLTPVVEGGSRVDQINESIKMDKLFSGFEKLSLTMNMRTAPGQLSLQEWLLKIGNGLTETGTKHTWNSKTYLEIPVELLTETLEDTVDFCFPSCMFDDPNKYSDAMKESAILCPTNQDTQFINDLAMHRMAGALKTFESIDEPLEPRDPFGTFRSDFNIEAIHNEMPSGMPPHKLCLKAGAPVMLIRNLDVSRGLCNGTRMQIKHLTEDNLYCQILTGPREKQDFIIPRVKFEYGQGRHHRGLRFRRIQFPVRPCFAMTVNKAQGQTLTRMGLVLRNGQCFSHGQVYVAFSRVTTMNGIRVFSPNTCRGEKKTIHNVVYPELLDTVPVLPQQTANMANVAVDEDSIDDFIQPEYDEDLDLPC